jgi:hypothetical protein
MNNFLVALSIGIFFGTVSSAQSVDYTRPSSIGVSFVLNDFASAERIRSSSFSSVINKKQFSKIREMVPGLAVSYFKGLKNNIDFAGTLAGSFASISLADNTPTSDQFLLEGDASVNLKLFSDKYLFTPYINLGIGISLYDGEFGTFLPLGAGLKLNIFNEAAIFINSQYRVPVTSETNNYHFFNSFGIAGTIGGSK